MHIAAETAKAEVVEMLLKDAFVILIKLNCILMLSKQQKNDN